MAVEEKERCGGFEKGAVVYRSFNRGVGEMKLNRNQMRDELQRLKRMSIGEMRKEMNDIHTRAYNLGVSHYSEAMDIVLTPKQKAAVIAKAVEIREDWDGIREVTVEVTR